MVLSKIYFVLSLYVAQETRKIKLWAVASGLNLTWYEVGKLLVHELQEFIV